MELQRRYAKFATDNLRVAAMRIESKRDTNVTELSRFRHGRDMEKASGQR